MDYKKVKIKPHTTDENGRVTQETIYTLMDDTIKTSIRKFETLKEFYAWQSDEFKDPVYVLPYKFIPPIDWSKLNEKR